ncbi:AAA family ATPase [Patescibacteria group bacterium]
MNFNFNLKETAIYRALTWEYSVFRFAGFFKKLFLAFLIFTFLVFLYGFLGQNLSLDSNAYLLGLSLIFAAFYLIFWLEELFFNTKIKNPKLNCGRFGSQVKILEYAALNPEKYNLAEFLSFEAAKTIDKSIKFTKSKKFSQINSSVLFYFLLKTNPELDFIFSRAILNSNEIEKLLKSYLGSADKQEIEKGYSIDFQNTILESFKVAKEKEHQKITTGDILIALSKHDPFFKKILLDNDLKAQDIESLVYWLEALQQKIKKGTRWWEYKNLMRRGTLAKEWAAGYTVTLDQYSTDWTDIIKKKDFSEVIGHKEELKAVERVLARVDKNNVLLVGEPGTGRRSIVQGLVIKSFFGQSVPEINYKRIIELDISSLLSKIANAEEVESALDAIFREAVFAGNIILVINDFHNYIGRMEGAGIIDISGIISSYLHFPQFQIIAITSYTGLHRYIEQNPSILSLFGKVEVSEISEKETLMLLESFALSLEEKHGIFITYPSLRGIIDYTAKYLPANPFPEKAMDLLDEVTVYVATSVKEKIVKLEHVSKIVAEKTEIPVGEMEEKEKEILLNLEDLIHQRIINQEEAVKEVSSALRRARAEISSKKGPMGGFLFLGPTGVGKTETSKALAEIYFGSESKIIRLDMSEFQSISDVSKIIGSRREEGLLTTKIREKPFSLILLDEIEKAHPNILNLFLQVLDEGHLTDGVGRRVDFKNSIIIATSNAGYKIILKALREKAVWSGVKAELLDYLFEKAIFRPEFINRFDAVVVFKPLNKENLLDISGLMLKKLEKNLEEKGIEFVITKPLKEKIVELGYDPTFGARHMKRVIQNKIENVLALSLLSGELKKGDRVEIDPKNFKTSIN